MATYPCELLLPAWLAEHPEDAHRQDPCSRGCRRLLPVSSIGPQFQKDAIHIAGVTNHSSAIPTAERPPQIELYFPRLSQHRRIESLYRVQGALLVGPGGTFHVLSLTVHLNFNCLFNSIVFALFTPGHELLDLACRSPSFPCPVPVETPTHMKHFTHHMPWNLNRTQST